MAAIVLGVLLGGRVSAEDGRTAAAAALTGGDPARAVTLDEDVAGRSGFLMVLDPGAADAAEHDAQVARIAWAKKLAAAGDVDSAVAALTVVRQPSLLTEAAQARALILIAAASAASRAASLWAVLSSSAGVAPVVAPLNALLSPPTRSTCPSGSSAATWNTRWLVSAPVGLNVPVAGSYSSAEASELSSPPPATSTLPLASSVVA